MNMMDIYLVNKSIDIGALEQELVEQMEITSSLIDTLYPELLAKIKSLNMQMFIEVLVKQMKETQLFFCHLYEPHSIQQTTDTFILNAEISIENSTLAFTQSIYMLNSMCHVSYDILLEEINGHLINSLAVVKKNTEKLVLLIEEINLKQ